MNEEKIWSYLRTKGLTDYAVAGIMGNLYAESGLVPNNLQNTYNSILGMTDQEYTTAVDNGSYKNFVYDQAGYGLAQWTFWSRKKDLQKRAEVESKSIGDLVLQLDFLVDELKEFGLFAKINSFTSVREASNLILFEYEKPFDTGTAVQNARANWSQGYYDQFAGKTPVQAPAPSQPQTGEYAVMAYKSFKDKTAAKSQLTDLQRNGFNGFITPIEF